MKTYAGIDLHLNNNFTGVIGEQNQRLYGRRLPKTMNAVVSALQSVREYMQEAGIQSTRFVTTLYLTRYGTNDFLGWGNCQRLCEAIFQTQQKP